MTLTIEQQFNCDRCSDSDYNVYTDDIIQILINWLEACSCIQWYRSHENLDRPDVEDTEMINGQYGIVEILMSSRDHNFTPARESLLTETIGCNAIHTQDTLTVQLDVYREQGEPNRDQRTDTSLIVGSPMDVLWRVNDKYKIERIRNALTKNKMVVTEWGSIEWNKRKIKNTWENVAIQRLEIEVCRKTSIADANIKCIELKICENEPKVLCDQFEPECD